MNFFGIGTDIVSIDRIRKSLKNKNFLKRIFNEIIVLNKKSGKPYIILAGQTKKTLSKRFKGKKSKVSLSLSDEKKYAVAFVTILL